MLTLLYMRYNYEKIYFIRFDYNIICNENRRCTGGYNENKDDYQ